MRSSERASGSGSGMGKRIPDAGQRLFLEVCGGAVALWPGPAIRAANPALRAFTDGTHEPMTDLTPLVETHHTLLELKGASADSLEALPEAELEQLEQLVGFPFSPTLKALFTTPGAMPRNDGIGVFGLSSWVGSRALQRNREVLAAREQGAWELPKLVVISGDEDFFAVTEAGDVVRVTFNEGNISRSHGPLDAFLERYMSALDAYAGAVRDYGDSDDEESEQDLEDFADALFDDEAQFCRTSAAATSE